MTVTKKEILKAITILGAIVSVVRIAQFVYENREFIITFIMANGFFVFLLVYAFIVTVLIIVYYVYNAYTSKVLRIDEYFKEYIENEGQHYFNQLNNKDAIIKEMRASIKELYKKGHTGTLSSKLYYFYLFSLLYGAKKRIWATSVMGGEEWVETAEELEFQRLNLLAAKNRKLVERIFVIKKDEIHKVLESKNVMEQIQKRDDYLKTYIVFREDVEQVKPGLIRELSNGFLAFDDYAVAEDVFENNMIRGLLQLDDEIITTFSKTFTNLRDFAVALDDSFIGELRSAIEE